MNAPEYQVGVKVWYLNDGGGESAIGYPGEIIMREGDQIVVRVSEEDQAWLTTSRFRNDSFPMFCLATETLRIRDWARSRIDDDVDCAVRGIQACEQDLALYREQLEKAKTNRAATLERYRDFFKTGLISTP